MRVEFYFAESLHPNSSELSIYDVAQILESKYGVVEDFCKEITKSQKLNDILVSQIRRYGYIRQVEVEEWVKNEWRKKARSGSLGGIEGAATGAYKERSPSRPFVDTQAYFLALQPRIVLNEIEKKSGVVRNS